MTIPTGDIVRGSILLALFAAGVIWVMVRSIKKAEDPARMVFKWILTIPLVVLSLLSVRLLGPFGPFLIVFCAIVLSCLWTPHLGAWFIKPLTSLFDGGDVEIEPRPAYSVAQSRQKQGRYTEAMTEIRKQLDKFPTDIEGQMLLAQIQAENL